MNIRKFRHSCLVLEEDGQSLVVDPGEWSTDFVVPKNVVGVIVTHEHGDHFSLEKLQNIVATNPDAVIYAHADVTVKIPDLATTTVTSGETKRIGTFSVQFTGGQHATIHPDYPVCANLGVYVNNGALYYPGDSFASAPGPVEVLAVPAAAPWLKIAEAMDFLAATKPKEYFLTHDAVLSPEGQAVAAAWLGRTAETIDATLL